MTITKGRIAVFILIIFILALAYLNQYLYVSMEDYIIRYYLKVSFRVPDAASWVRETYYYSYSDIGLLSLMILPITVLSNALYQQWKWRWTNRYNENHVLAYSVLLAIIMISVFLINPAREDAHILSIDPFSNQQIAFIILNTFPLALVFFKDNQFLQTEHISDFILVILFIASVWAISAFLVFWFIVLIEVFIAMWIVTFLLEDMN